jgi:hypothetical protein
VHFYAKESHVRYGSAISATYVMHVLQMLGVSRNASRFADRIEYASLLLNRVTRSRFAKSVE